MVAHTATASRGEWGALRKTQAVDAVWVVSRMALFAVWPSEQLLHSLLIQHRLRVDPDCLGLQAQRLTHTHGTVSWTCQCSGVVDDEHASAARHVNDVS